MGAAGGSWPTAKGDTGAAGAIGGGTGAALGAGTVISMPHEHFACLPAKESSSV
tara:strand:+ start:876 stop:1037 length:162 start_codon:yes stop_codon:yes gene_type:complete